MKRTNLTQNFFLKNRRLILLTVIVLLGCGGGVFLYDSLQGEALQHANALLPVRQVPEGIGGAVVQTFVSCFHTVCLLLIVFIGGLSVCGVPLAVTALLFWGVGLGMTLGYYYSFGGVGVLFSAVIVLPHSLPEAIVLLMGCSQTLHLSMQLGGQLLPHGAHCGGLWQDFRMYCIRFLILLPLLFCAGVLDVGIRMLVLRLFPDTLWI